METQASYNNWTDASGQLIVYLPEESAASITHAVATFGDPGGPPPPDYTEAEPIVKRTSPVEEAPARPGFRQVSFSISRVYNGARPVKVWAFDADGPVSGPYMTAVPGTVLSSTHPGPKLGISYWWNYGDAGLSPARTLTVSWQGREFSWISGVLRAGFGNPATDVFMLSDANTAMFRMDEWPDTGVTATQRWGPNLATGMPATLTLFRGGSDMVHYSAQSYDLVVGLNPDTSVALTGQGSTPAVAGRTLSYMARVTSAQAASGGRSDAVFGARVAFDSRAAGGNWVRRAVDTTDATGTATVSLPSNARGMQVRATVLGSQPLRTATLTTMATRTVSFQLTARRFERGVPVRALGVVTGGPAEATVLVQRCAKKKAASCSVVASKRTRADGAYRVKVPRPSVTGRGFYRVVVGAVDDYTPRVVSRWRAASRP